MWRLWLCVTSSALRTGTVFFVPMINVAVTQTSGAVFVLLVPHLAAGTVVVLRVARDESVIRSVTIRMLVCII